jgi:spermidine/putrescine-binding protein
VSRFLAPLLLTLLLPQANAEDVIRVYNWTDHIAPQVLVDFAKETGIRVDYHAYDTTEELSEALASGESIDVAVAGYELLPELIDDGALLPLDKAQLPNRQHLDKQLLGKLAAFDPGNRYAQPYLWGSVGLAINTPAAEKAFGGPLPESWSLLFDPAQSKRLASCGLSVLNDSDEVLLALMSYQGRNLSNSSPKQIQHAGKVLQQLRPNFKYVDSERYVEDLNNGKICVAMAWVGDALAAADEGQPVQFIIPQEGATVFIDSLIIPKSAKRPDLALRFMNYLMEPKVAALITSETLYPSANAAAKALLEPALRDQPGLYPDQKAKRRLSVTDLQPEYQAATRDAVWQQFTSGQ